MKFSASKQVLPSPTKKKTTKSIVSCKLKRCIRFDHINTQQNKGVGKKRKLVHLKLVQHCFSKSLLGPVKSITRLAHT